VRDRPVWGSTRSDRLRGIEALKDGFVGQDAGQRLASAR
jgi:hypothetical protein